MMEFWKKLGLFLGFGLPPEEKGMPVQEARQPQAPPRDGTGADWALGFGSALPGMHGQMALPVGPGQTITVDFAAITVGDLFLRFQYLIQARENWPFGPDPEAFAGHIALQGPGWDLYVFFRKPMPRVEYYAGRSDGAERVAGEARWESVVQALVLCPDYDAVVGYLKLNPYALWGYSA